MTRGDRASPSDELSIEPCISDAALADILEGRAAPGVLTAAQIHAADCEGCRELLANVGRVRAREQHELTSVGPDATTDGARGLIAQPDPLVGTSVGRFRILERLGQGGMGIVYAARDETLQRRVALKILRRAVPSDADGGRERLLREARAMASVEHPNVVAVHEVGLHDGRVFIVMDLVVGTDLAVWCRQSERSFRETMRVWIEAGRGLEAVHAFGLVHRDFKPQNVLVAENGRVQVTDFGLVAAGHEVVHTPDPDRLQALVGHMRTETGVVLGTPRYMPPEQLSAGKVDFTGDQFAYCVSLWEALTGVHPFGSDSAIERLERVRTGSFDAGTKRVPSGVLAALQRGLAFDPSARFPDMGALLHALQKAGDAGRRRLEIATGALVLAGAIGVGVWVGARVEGSACEAPADGDFAGVWDRERRRDLEAKVTAIAQHDEAERVVALLDDYTARWSAMRRDACEATRVREEVSEDMLDRRMACLAQRRSAVAAFVELLRGDAIGLEVSPLELAFRLPSLRACEDLVRLDAEPSRPDDPDARRRIEAVEAEIVEIEVLSNAGLRSDALARMDAVEARAKAEAWSPLYANALITRAQISSDLADATAIEDWHRAYVAAVAAGPVDGFNAAMTGARTLARSGDASGAAFALDVAEAHAAQLGREPRQGEIPTMRALLARERGDLSEAEGYLREAIEVLTNDPDLPDELALAWGNLGGVLAAGGRIDEATEATDRALELTAAHFGEQHLFTLKWRTNRAAIELMAYHYDEAAKDAEAALAGLRKLDAEPDVASALLVLGRARAATDHVEEGCALIGEALAIQERLLPPGSSTLRNGRYHLALCEVARERYAVAEGLLRRALDDAPPSDATPDLEALLALCLAQTGRTGAALEITARWADTELEPATEHDMLAARALALRAQGNVDAAIDTFRDAVALQEPGLNDSRSAPSARLALADLLYARGDVDDARAQVDAAIAFMDRVGDRENALWRQLHAWLERHR